jgi:hypothetical protein
MVRVTIFEQLVIARGDGETWDDVHARREDPARKLTKFKRGVYDSILEGLAKRATRGGS